MGKRFLKLLFLFVFLIFLFPVKYFGAGVNPDFYKLPIYFIKNEGQLNKVVKFYARTKGYTLWVTKDSLVFDSIYGKRENRKRSVVKIKILNGNKDTLIQMGNLSNYRVNYFIGKDKNKWYKNIPTSKEVYFRDIYKNIDLKVYGSERNIEYDFVVNPGGDVDDILFKVEGDGSAKIDNEGNLNVDTPFGRVTFKKPYTYQEKNRKVDSKFVEVKENTFGFRAKNYDRSKKLIIDPVTLVYSTFLGGSDEERGYAIAVDTSGCAYVTGKTESDDFPTENAYDDSLGGYEDAFVTKLSADGSSLVYSTYLGGSSGDEGDAIAVDSSDCAYVTGHTDSTNFPTVNAYDSSYNGDGDAFVTKFSANGKSIIYSTYLGGNSSDVPCDIAVDSSKSAYVAGHTNSTNFPTTNSYQKSKDSEGYDVFITKFSPNGSSLIYSTCLGGSNDDEFAKIAVDSSGCAYVTGETRSNDFPVVNAYDNILSGNNDAFVSKLSADGGSLIYSTYLGGDDNNWGSGIAVDSSGCAYVTGHTSSTNFPTANAYDNSYNGGSNDAFITKLKYPQADLSQADLSITKSAGPSHFSAGDRIRYTLTIKNNGPEKAKNVTVIDNIPSEIKYPVYSTDGGVSWRNWNNTLNIGDLLSGSGYEILIEGDIDSDYEGDMTNEARVSSDTDDPDDSNNSSSVIVNVSNKGDINGDGKIDINDAILLKNYFVRNAFEIKKGKADMDNSGKVDIVDLILLLIRISG